MLKIIERLFLKKRYIYIYEPSKKVDSFHIVWYHTCSIDKEIANSFNSIRLLKYLERRRGERSWYLFAYIDQGIMKGYSFLHLPHKEEWHDSLPTRPGEARETATFVEPEYRGQGIRGGLLAAQFKYCQENNKKMWAVIERSNVSSIKSTLKNGGKCIGSNYLIKVLGKNVISIVTKPLKVYWVLER